MKNKNKTKTSLKITSFLLLLLLLLLTLACSKDSNRRPYKGCCETEALTAKVGSGNIYVPNIFSPNGDGFSDLFFVHGGIGIDKISNFRILSNQGREIYQATDLMPNNPLDGWDGTRKGKYWEGLFQYEIEVLSTDGTIKTFEGQACSFICEGDDEGLISEANFVNCLFGSQHDGNGGVNITLPHLENPNCFE